MPTPTPHYTIVPADRDRLGRFISGGRDQFAPLLVGDRAQSSYDPAILVPRWCRPDLGYAEGQWLFADDGPPPVRAGISAVGVRRNTHEERLWCSMPRDEALQVISRHRELRGNNYPTHNA